MKEFTLVREHDSVEEYLQALKKTNGRFDLFDYIDCCLCDGVLDKVNIMNPSEPDIIKVTQVGSNELGFQPWPVKVKDILTVAKERGLEFCPPWVAFQWTLEYARYFQGASFSCGYDPKADPESVFHVGDHVAVKPFYRGKYIFGTGGNHSFGSELSLTRVIQEIGTSFNAVDNVYNSTWLFTSPQ